MHVDGNCNICYILAAQRREQRGVIWHTSFYRSVQNQLRRRWNVNGVFYFKSEAEAGFGEYVSCETTICDSIFENESDESTAIRSTIDL
jgi:hypothetical protein